MATAAAHPTPRKILDGKLLSQGVARALTDTVSELRAKHKSRAPGLGVILVGESPASKTYVASKQTFAKKCGVETFDKYLPDTTTQEALLAIIDELNSDERVDGILLQLPLPKHLNSAECLLRILPEKDADGLHPYNQGLLMQGLPGPRSCTPLGVMALLDLALSENVIFDPQGCPDVSSFDRVDLSGKSAVVIGRSQLVGKPVAFLLLERNATVTIAHSRTKYLPDVVRQADIVVAAVGIPHLVKRDWIKPGALVLDVGINRLPTGKLAGDVAFDEVAEVAGPITPVPGGVGPMTVAMLIQNTVTQYAKKFTS